MADLRKSIRGSIHKDGERTLLLLDEAAGKYYLSFALLERGSEQEIFPESLLDDWGHEISNLSLYSWIQENGIHFPRAELFGYDWKGLPSQCFLRDLDLTAKYPTYLFSERRQPISEGFQVAAIGLPDGAIVRPERVRTPEQLDIPLSNAKVQWWLLDPDNLIESGQTILAESDLGGR